MPAVIAGMGRLMQQLDQLGLSFTPEDLLPGAMIIFDISQDLCPVDTGYLRSTGGVEVTNDDVIISYFAEYASYLEFGTSRMEAQPFLRPAIDQGESAALQAIGERIDANWGRGNFGVGGVQTQGNPSGNLQP